MLVIFIFIIIITIMIITINVITRGEITMMLGFTKERRESDWIKEDPDTLMNSLIVIVFLKYFVLNEIMKYAAGDALLLKSQ